MFASENTENDQVGYLSKKQAEHPMRYSVEIHCYAL
jgi:hypothetical protein